VDNPVDKCPLEILQRMASFIENFISQDDGALKILQQKPGIITKNNGRKAWKCELFFVSL
jgi:hypothetical protein